MNLDNPSSEHELANQSQHFKSTKGARRDDDSRVPPATGTRDAKRVQCPDHLGLPPKPSLMSNVVTPGWNAHPFRALLKLSWPITVSMLSFALMTLVDTLFVARLGADALAGVGLGGVAFFTVACFVMGMMRAVKVLVSQARGSGQGSLGDGYLGAGIAWALIFGVVLGVVGLWVSTLLPLFTASPEAGVAAMEYTFVRSLSMPLLFVWVALREYRYAVGDSRSPMWATVIANVANVGLDYLFIFHFEWGVAGAAWATVAAVVVQLAWVALVQAQARIDIRRFRLSHMQDIFRVGLPTGTEFLMEVGSFALIATILGRIGSLDLAAHQIVLQAVHFSFLPALAIAEAASIMAGEAVGGGRNDLVYRVGRAAFSIVGVFSLLCAVAFVLGRYTMSAAFTEDPQLLEKAATAFVVAGLFQVFDGISITVRSLLRGTGDVRFPAYFTIFAAWTIVPPAAFYLGEHLGMGVVGAWIGLALQMGVISATLLLRFIRGHWQVAANASRARLLSTGAHVEPVDTQVVTAA